MSQRSERTSYFLRDLRGATRSIGIPPETTFHGEEEARTLLINAVAGMEGMETVIPLRRLERRRDSTNRVSFTIPVHKEDGPPTYKVACNSFSFLIKLLQTFTSIVAAGLYSVGVKLVEHDITSQQLPFVVTSSFIIITGIIILSYVLGQKMPELLIRMYNLVGTVLFAVAGIVIINYWIEFYDYWEGCVQWRNRMLLATGILCLINSFFYAIDVFFSIKRTLSLINQ